MTCGSKSLMSMIGTFLLLVCGASSVASAQTKPNVILIVSDDQGYRDLGCLEGSQVLTPHLDRLAKQGTRLTNFYVSWPACTPSRGSILTGRYPQRNGIYDMIRNEAPDYGHEYDPAAYEVTFERIGGMDLREVLFPSLLQQQGYRTAIFGKWDLGTLKRFLPTSRGFDEFYGFVNTGIDYFTHERYGVPSMYRNAEPTTADEGTCATDLFRREAERFIKENHERPFFLYLPFNAPHNASNLDPKIRGGAQASPEFLALYPELAKEAKFVEGVQYGKPALKPNLAMRTQLYRASVTEMDDAIGKVLTQLDELGIADNTLVIFFSDNGGSGGADNAPLRGHKAQMWEGGIRVPCIIRWPGKVAANSINDSFLTALEVMPTILAATRTTAPEEIILDGFDMLPVITDKTEQGRQQMYWQRRDERAARIGHWKWVDTPKGGGLFDLSQDIGEQHDLSQSHPEKRDELRQAFAAWEEQMQQSDPRGPFRDF